MHIFPRKEDDAKSYIFAKFASRGDVSHLTAFVEALEKECCRTRLGLLEMSFHSLLKCQELSYQDTVDHLGSLEVKTSERLLGLRKLKKPTFQRWTRTEKHCFKLFGFDMLGVWDLSFG